MMKYEVSVIVPMYNVEKYLSRCLNSIISQDFDSFEIVIVDDGSTDGSLKIAQEYADQYVEKIKIISQSNKGAGGARNTGIAHAEGKYLLFVDSDDTIRKNTLKILYDKITRANADIAFFGIKYADEKGNIVFTQSWFDDEYVEFQLDDYPYLFALDPYICDKMIKRSLFVDNNIWFTERIWYEDLQLEAKLILNAKKMIALNDAFYTYCLRSGSVMHNPNIEKNLDMLYVVKDIIDYFSEQGVYKKYYSQLELLTMLHIMVLCTKRVVLQDTKSDLLKKYYEFTRTNFPGFAHSKTKKELPLKHRVILELSIRKMYRCIYLISRSYDILKKIKNALRKE